MELSTQEEMIRRKVDRIFRDIAAYIERALRDAVAAGEISNLNTSLTAQAIVAYMEGVMLLAKTRNDPKLLKQLGQRTFRQVLTGLAPAAQSKTSKQ